MNWEVTVQTGIHEFDCFEIEANSEAEAILEGAKLGNSPIIIRSKLLLN